MSSLAAVVSELNSIIKKEIKVKMKDTEYIIKVENVSFAYQDDEDDNDASPALCNINVDIKKGEYVSVLGHNGSGKSTLAKLLNLILVPNEGCIYFNGKNISSDDLTEDEIFEVRKNIGMVFQNPDNQLVATVVEEDVAFGPENLGLPSEEIRRRVYSALRLVGMEDYAKHAPHKLSGGQKQRVAIAGIIAMHPQVVIFDESTAMLDPIGRKDVLNIMERLNREEGITIINITHYMEEAARADRVIVINDGSLVIDGTPGEVFAQVQQMHSMGLESPQSTELLFELYKCGLDVNYCGIVKENDCIEALLKLLSHKD